jgi:SAM-dependent methyltransferase
LAVAACVFHHIPPQDRLHWTRELNRVLKPGAQFFIYEHNPLNPLTRKVVRDCEFDEDAILLPLQESRELLLQAGFDDISHDYIVFFPRILGFLRPIERLLRSLPLGAQYAVRGTARKAVRSQGDMLLSDEAPDA